MRRLVLAAPFVAAVLACAKPPPPAAPAPTLGGTDPAGGPIANVPDPSSPGSVAAAATATAGVIGTAHPIVLEAVAADGAWVTVCQARRDTNNDGQVYVHSGHHGDTFGDDFVPYLVRGGGDGEELESFIGATRDGRWLVAKRKRQLALLDVRTWTWTDLLGADLRDDHVPLGPHRNASLAASGDRMTYLRGDDTIVIRDLASGAERTVAVPGALVWRVEVDAGGAWARVYVVRKDSDGDGKLSWPQLQSSLSDRDCRGPIMSYSTGGWAGDAFETLWLDLSRGTLVDEGAVVIGPAGPHLVRVLATGALTLDGAAVATATCDAEVVALSAAPPRVLYTCKPRSRTAEPALELAGPAVKVTTTLRAPRLGKDRNVATPDTGWYCATGVCLDLATGADHKVAGSDDTVAAHGNRLLVAQADKLTIVDLHDGTTTPLTITGSHGAASGPIIAIGQQLVDLSAARVLGAITGRILAVDNRGRALIGPDDGGYEIPSGPLHWALPK